MVTILTFPLRNDLPQYSFPITLSGSNYVIQMIFNVRMNRWIMNINDVAGNQILSGIPVLIERNLTGQYATLAIPAGVFLAVDNTGQDSQPTQYSFGVDHTCYYLDPGA
jgi:hypothetical protein